MVNACLAGKTRSDEGFVTCDRIIWVVCCPGCMAVRTPVGDLAACVRAK